MAENYGKGTSRTLSAKDRAFAAVSWSAKKPPLDAELNLMGQIQIEALAEAIRSSMPSGFLSDPARSFEDFVFDESFSNQFVLGAPGAAEQNPVVWANVNGWIIPVAGTAVSTDGDVRNVIKLASPPTGSSRIDFVFLEAWLAIVKPNPSSINKPDAAHVWKWGNVANGGATAANNPLDDIKDPSVSYETTKRIQLQWRIRSYGDGQGLGTSTPLDALPDGLGASGIYAQGTAIGPVPAMGSFQNMSDELGDPSLWRAGDGNPNNFLGTVDGYTYAIPICAVFRRNSDTFKAFSLGAPANPNGAKLRNTSAQVLSTATLTTALSWNSTGVIAVSGLTSSGIPGQTLSSTYLQIEDEILGPLTALDAVNGTVTIAGAGRGRLGTLATRHLAGTVVRLHNHRVDGLYADQIAAQDVLDLRRTVTPGQWDYQGLLANGVASLLKGELRSSWKVSPNGSQGVSVLEVDSLGSVSGGYDILDGANGIRTVWSDSAVLQKDVTVLLNPDSPSSMSSGSSSYWSLGASLQPNGFLNSAGGWANGSLVFLFLDDARSTVSSGNNEIVRFVSPTETSDRFPPITLSFPEQSICDRAATHAAIAAGPLYSPERTGHLAPFIVLGGLAHPDLKIAPFTINGKFSNWGSENTFEIDLASAGLNFDLSGDWIGPAFTETNPAMVSRPLVRGTRTLYDLLTHGGTDVTGDSSELFLVMWGDPENPDNNGCFQVVGAGSLGMTSRTSIFQSSIVVRPLSKDYDAPVTGSTHSVQIEFRTFQTNADGDRGVADLAIVLTDLNAGNWNGLATAAVPGARVSVRGPMLFSGTLLYHPGRGATSRVPDSFHRLSLLGDQYLHQSATALDALFPAPDQSLPEIHFKASALQLWNRLDALGGHQIGPNEADREAALFVDAGSKTMVFRPFAEQVFVTASFMPFPSMSYNLLGTLNYVAGTLLGSARDPAGLFTSGLRVGYSIPTVALPRFGRQDIPIYVDTTGTAPFLPGLNHLFKDSTDLSDATFRVIGGEDTDGVKVLHISTAGPSYGQAGTYGSKNVIGARLTKNAGDAIVTRCAGVRSSDVGPGLDGIQFPPYIGPARIIGVYEAADFASKSGRTVKTNRWQVDPADPATNLLRFGASKQTLFLMQDGASDATGELGDHTYILPKQAVDVTRIPGYDPIKGFNDYDYVIVATVFGFSKDWINGNGFVLARRHDGVNGSALQDIESGNALAVQDSLQTAILRMIVPSPAKKDDLAHVVYARTPYQGDPYGTRNGEVRTMADSRAPYGQITVAQSYPLGMSLAQYAPDGSPSIQIPNARAFEVLASMDFHTTLGTGRLGGFVREGTSLDVGYVDVQQRFPRTSNDVAPRTLAAAFTALPGPDSTAASATVKFLSPDWLAQANVDQNLVVTITPPEGSPVVFWLVPTANQATLMAKGVADGAFDKHASNVTVVYSPTNVYSDVMLNLTNVINRHDVGQWVHASGLVQDGVPSCRISALPLGEAGNDIYVNVGFRDVSGGGIPGAENDVMAISMATIALPTDRGFARRIQTRLGGGVNQDLRAGAGNGMASFQGMTARLPLGFLTRDHDFIGENPLRDNASAFHLGSGTTSLPMSAGTLAPNGTFYGKALYGPGSLIGMADGSDSEDTAGHRFRRFRGASAYVLSGNAPGGPLEWSLDLTAPGGIMVKGAILACKALLVRNFKETAFGASPCIPSYGDEIQMVILSHAHFGQGQELNPAIAGTLSPTGYGEGFAAADRYRLPGRPMFKGQTNLAPDATDVVLAPLTRG